MYVLRKGNETVQTADVVVAKRFIDLGFSSSDDTTILKLYSEKTKKEKCAQYIYHHYPPIKQQSDVADKNYYETLIKAKGATNLEAGIVARAERFFGGESLESIISDVADTEKEAYEQLLKVAIRVKWVQDCKAELKAAIAEEREPNFPAYPL